MGRRYGVPIEFAGYTTGGHLVQFKSGALKVSKLCSVRIAQSSNFGDAQADGLEVLIQRNATAFTAGGTVIVPSPLEPFDTAWNGEVRPLPTTTGPGALVELVRGGWNIQSEWIWAPPPGTFEIVIAPASTVLVTLSGAIAAADLQFYAELEELG